MNTIRKHKSIPILLLLTAVTILFAVLTPKVRATLLPQSSIGNFAQFEKSITTNQRLNPQTFWEFREFYSPGVHTTNKKGLNTNEVNGFLQKLPADFQEKPQFPFSTFKSPNLEALESLTDAKSLKKLYKIDEKNMHNLITSTDRLIFYQVNPREYVLIGLFSTEEMKKTVGFWNYQKDQKIIDNKNWLSITRITLPE